MYLQPYMHNARLKHVRNSTLVRWRMMGCLTDAMQAATKGYLLIFWNRSAAKSQVGQAPAVWRSISFFFQPINLCIAFAYRPSQPINGGHVYWRNCLTHSSNLELFPDTLICSNNTFFSPNVRNTSKIVRFGLPACVDLCEG